MFYIRFLSLTLYVVMYVFIYLFIYSIDRWWVGLLNDDGLEEISIDLLSGNTPAFAWIYCWKHMQTLENSVFKSCRKRSDEDIHSAESVDRPVATIYCNSCNV
jgi:hypothetical protein